MMSNTMRHNPYFNRWFSAIIIICITDKGVYKVTILILIDGFLQSERQELYSIRKGCHNPYFNRWFSAMSTKEYLKGQQVMSQSLF